MSKLQMKRNKYCTTVSNYSLHMGTTGENACLYHTTIENVIKKMLVHESKEQFPSCLKPTNEVGSYQKIEPPCNEFSIQRNLQLHVYGRIT